MMNNWNIHVTANGKYNVWNFDILALHVFAVNTEHKLDTWNEQLEIQGINNSFITKYDMALIEGFVHLHTNTVYKSWHKTHGTLNNMK